MPSPPRTRAPHLPHAARLGLLTLSLCTATAAPAQPDDPDDLAALRDEVRALRQEIDQLRREGAATPAPPSLEQATRNAAPDAAARNDFDPAPATSPNAGYDGGFFLADPDDNFRLNVGGLLQVRYTANFRDDPLPTATGNGDEDDAGFTVHRARLKFDGHVYDPRLRYFIQLDANRSNGNVFLLDAFVDYDLNPESQDTPAADATTFTLRGGRFKAPFLREQLAGAGASLAVERSLVHAAFTAGRTEGLALYANAPDLRLSVSLNDGVRAAPSDFNDDASDLAATARADLKLFGTWKQFNDFAAFARDKPSLFLGAAAHYELGETGNDTVNRDLFLWTVDGSYEAGAVNLFASVVGRHTDPDLGNPADEYGTLAQLGVMAIPDRLQPFVRYEHLDLAGGADDVDLVTAGANIFFRKHDAQLSLDAVYVLDPLAAGSTTLGLLPAGDSDQLALRAQFQVGF